MANPPTHHKNKKEPSTILRRCSAWLATISVAAVAFLVIADGTPATFATNDELYSHKTPPLCIVHKKSNKLTAIRYQSSGQRLRTPGFSDNS